VLFSLGALKHLQSKKIPVKEYVVFFLLIILSSIPKNSQAQKTNVLKLRIVQANIGNFLKIDSEKGGEPSIKKVYESYFNFSTKEPRSKIDLIVWPETAFPTLINGEKIKLGENTLHPIFKDITEHTNAEIFFGGYDYSLNSDFNAAFFLDKKGSLKDVYHKIKLIPFGEGLPFGPLNPYLKKYAENVSFFTSGEEFTQFKLESGNLFQSAICYEILFPEFIRDLLNSQKTQSQFIINPRTLPASFFN
jgi:apolipoprotein N-acyltransferase